MALRVGSSAGAAGGGELVPADGESLEHVAGPHANAVRILQWPDAFLAHVDGWLLTLGTGSTIPPAALAALQERGLVDSREQLTSLGQNLLARLLLREGQKGDEQFYAFIQMTGLGAGSRVLDVGCSIGQTLAFLAPRLPSELVGIDVDLEALALGVGLSRRDAIPIRFFHGTGHRLPFLDNAFTHVICRNSLTYMHHRRALNEMLRVLRPGGFICLRFENLFYDLNVLSRPWRDRSFRFLCRLRDFQAGVLNALTGWQPLPGSKLGGGRAFATRRRVKGILARLGCKVLRVEGSQGCARFLGIPTQTSLLALKTSASVP